MLFEIGNIMAQAQAADAASKVIVSKDSSTLTEGEIQRIRQARITLANVANTLGSYLEPVDGFPANRSTEQI